MPTELKSIGDFYKPPDLGAVLSNQRGVEQLDIQRQQMEQQGKNLSIDNALAQFKVDITDNPIAAFASYNKARTMQGLPPETDVNKFIADPSRYAAYAEAKTPEARAAAEMAIAGQGSVAAKRGLAEYERTASREGAGAVLRSVQQGDTPAEREFYAQNPAAITQLTQAATDVRRAEQVKAIQLDNEHKELKANINAQLLPLVPLNKQVQQSMKDMAPQLEQIRVLDQQFDTDSRNRGSVIAEGLRTDRINANADLKELLGRAKSSEPQLKAQIQELTGKRIQVATQVDLMENKVIPTPIGKSLAAMKGELEVSDLHVQLLKAKLNFAKSATPASVDALQSAAQAIADHEAGLKTRMSDAEERLAIANKRFNLEQSKEDRSIASEQQLQQGQSELLRAVTKGEDVDVAAARIADKTGVAPALLKKALEDPRKRGQVELKIAAIGERKELAEGRATLQGIQEIDALYNDKFVGKYDNFVAKLKGPLNLLTPEEAEFRAAVKKQAAQLRKLYAGLAQSKQELILLLDSIPDTDQSETNFTASIKATRKNVERINRQIVDVGKEVGMKMPNAMPSLTDKQKKQAEQLQRDNPGDSLDTIMRFLQGTTE